MKKWIIRIGIGLMMVPIIYIGIGLGLSLLSRTDAPVSDTKNLKFDDLNTKPIKQIPKKKSFQARDGHQLDYRYYPLSDGQNYAGKKNILIMMHGSGHHSKYMHPLANYLKDEQIADVYTPDMRGHGENVDHRGDVEYVGQLEDDLQDFIKVIKNKHPDARIILSGHSSGGGLVIRYAGGRNQDLVDAYLLLAPYIHHKAPVNSTADSGWANPNVPRIIGLSMLNQLKISGLNYLPVISFNMPENMRDGSETLEYSYRMQYSMVPRDDYNHDIKQLKAPTLVLAGSEDRSFNSKEYKPIFNSNPNADVRIVNGLSHFGIVTEKESHSMIAKWIQELSDTKQ